ncbi:MAG: BatA domain-containing protein, partial [Gemmatimonadota bacterium]
MSFLAPAFLAGLVLLAVPILVHLTQRQRSEVHAFPSLMFLRRVPFRT